jgi:hypothetical protein
MLITSLRAKLEANTPIIIEGSLDHLALCSVVVPGYASVVNCKHRAVIDHFSERSGLAMEFFLFAFQIPKQFCLVILIFA